MSRSTKSFRIQPITPRQGEGGAFMHHVIQSMLACATGLGLALPAQAAPLPFAQYPAEAAYRLPAPNVIVSVDNARGMEQPDPGAVRQPSGPQPTRLDAVRRMLARLFDPSSLPDGSVRLAYQAAFGCTRLPRDGEPIEAQCIHNGIPNRMAPLAGSTDTGESSTRGACMRWLAELRTGDSAGADSLGSEARRYLAQTGAENPWQDVPGAAQPAAVPKPCRRAYHLLLADGQSLESLGGPASGDANPPIETVRGISAIRRALDGIAGPVGAGDGGEHISGAIAGSAAPARGPVTLFTSAYQAGAWSGYVFASQATGEPPGAMAPDPGWGVVEARAGRAHRTTADRLDALPDVGARLILTHNGERGVPFQWSAESGTLLSSAQQQWLQSSARDAGHGARLLNYLRGDRSFESGDAPNGFRPRASRQGDIVHSQIWHVGKPSAGHADSSYRAFARTHADRPAMLYVGGNDGMLHGFAAATGDEMIAYVPQGVYRNLPQLASRAYRHRYFVDGSPFTGDVELGQPPGQTQWRTLLVGTLGAGGPGYFVLDVTTPTSPQQPGSGNFAQQHAQALVVMDRSDGGDPDIGHILAAPTLSEANAQRSLQITRTNNRRWAAILGNGYNSRRERPVLLVQYLDGERELLKIEAASAPGSPGNGLSAPQFLDVNGDDVPDFIYAGDLDGNLWKFDISAASDQRWRVANQGAPFYRSRREGSPQPITAAPVLRAQPRAGGLLVAFGTGRNLTEADQGDASVQSVYAVMDYTRYALIESGEDQGKVAVDSARSSLPAAAQSRSELMAQKVQDGDRPGTPGAGSGSQRAYWSISHTPFAYCTTTPCAPDERKGWYIDLPAPRERVLQSPAFYDGNVLEILSHVPAAPAAPPSADRAAVESCGGGLTAAQDFRMLLQMATGAPAQTRTMDVNGDGRIDADDGNAARSSAAAHEIRWKTGARNIRIAPDGPAESLGAIPTIVLRPSWRHIK